MGMEKGKVSPEKSNSRTDSKVNLSFNPHEFPRETARHYISASDEELQAMLSTIGFFNLSQLYAHIDPALLFPQPLSLPEEFSYFEVAENIANIASLSNQKLSFIGDQLPVWKTPEIVDFVSNLRNLSTSYTPYQPERSQGTLISHWIYQCAISTLTGFEAINTSLYDRTFAIYEAIIAHSALVRNRQEFSWHLPYSRRRLKYLILCLKKLALNLIIWT